MDKRSKWKTESNLIALQRNYINKILNSCEGMKALIFDDVTIKIISVVFMQSDGFANDAFLVENIKHMGLEKVSSVIGILILSNTESSIKKLENLLKDPILKEYHIFFTSKVDKLVITRLADADKHDRVKRFQEIFFEYQAMTPEMMSCDFKVAPSFGSSDPKLKTMINALSGLILNLRKKPKEIHYLGDDHFCELLAKEAEKILLKETLESPKEFFDDNTLVIVTHRREDPITPLVFDWSYLAMIHECLGLDNNVTKTPRNQYNLFLEEDSFLKDNLYSNYGEVASNLKTFLETIAMKKKQNLKIERFEDMQKVMEMMPEMSKNSNIASKHVDITGEISKEIKSRNLILIGEMEQNMLTKYSKAEAYKELLKRLDDYGTKTKDLIRLILMFSIKYEGDQKAKFLQGKLKERLGPENRGDMVLFMNALNCYSREKRKNSFFDQNLTNSFKSKFKQYFKNVPNVYCSYIPYLKTLITEAMTGQLNLDHYRSTKLSFRQEPNTSPVSNVIVFIVGGVTYSESRIIATMRVENPGVGIYLGGSQVLNTNKYLRELKSMDRHSISDL